MPLEALALDIKVASAERWEIAVHPVGETEEAERLLLLGYDSVAALALAQSLPGVTVAALESLDDAARALAELGGDAPWIEFGQFDLLEAWTEADGSGVLGAITRLDAGELAALALPTLEARELKPFLVAVGLDSLSDTPGLPRSRAVAALWAALAEPIAKRPYAVRKGLGDLLHSSGHPLADAWRAAAAGDKGDEPAILDSLLRQRLGRLTPPQGEPDELPDTTPIDTREVADWFQPNGPIAKEMGQYERRDGQVSMAVAVAEALNTGSCLLVEAGTGTGKSIAYLAPALKFAVQNQTPVVVSTNTKNLQDQLRAKDLPLLARALPFEFRAELIKGRGNYLCVEKLLGELADVGLLPFDDQVFNLCYLLSWAAETATGDLDELSGYLTWKSPHLDRYAHNLASDSESCTATSARNHPCFATAARRRAMDADLLVINHALALANATIEVLPTFGHLILDEAHNLEDIATEAFGMSLDRRGLQSLARELAGSRQNRSVTQRVQRLLDDVGVGGDELRGLLTGAEALAEDVIQATEDYGEQLSGWLMQLKQIDRQDLDRSERMRLLPNLYEGPLGPSLRTAADNLHGRMTELGDLGKQLMLALTAMGTGDGGSDELNQVKQAAQARFADWSEQIRALGLLRELADERYVYWLEVAWRRDRWEWRLKAAPIEAGEALAEHVYEKLQAVVMTSATLTVDGKFDYFSRRLGLTLPAVSDRARSLVVPSSFDYPGQVLLGLPDNIALPNQAPFENHVARAIDDIAKQLDGRTLVLFTSIRAMKNVFGQLESRLEAIGIEPLCQTISGPRHALAERFRSNPHSVLFGTRSFWEGIDVPGDALQCVVLVKLPFTVPDDPVYLARCERLEADGINAWSAYAVPQAVILFKQGFGRLIRTNTDRGVVLCLDRRVREKSYGRAFLRSVPGYTSAFGSWSQIKSRVQSWLTPETEPVAGRKRS